MNVDDFIASIRPDTYEPTGYGDYVSLPCGVCGCTSFLLEDVGPVCLACSLIAGEVEVKAEQLSQAMDAVGELMRVAKGSAREELHTLALLWQVTVARWVMATGSDRG